jgi:hypothetical protein
MASAPSPIFCLEFHRLKTQYERAVTEFLRKQSGQLAAIINGDDTMTFDEQVHAAGIAKEKAKYVLLAHCKEHGCGE